ncbi:hypothetical protein EI012_27060 [Escherichia coli]|nr:hypothetical protein [Escherichia coli]
MKAKERKTIFHANGDQKKAGVAILISDKVGFKMKNILRDKEGHYIMIKGSALLFLTLKLVHTEPAANLTSTC